MSQTKKSSDAWWDFLLKIGTLRAKGTIKKVLHCPHTSCYYGSFTSYRERQVKTFWRQCICVDIHKTNVWQSDKCTYTVTTCYIRLVPDMQSFPLPHDIKLLHACHVAENGSRLYNTNKKGPTCSKKQTSVNNKKPVNDIWSCHQFLQKL